MSSGHALFGLRELVYAVGGFLVPREMAALLQHLTQHGRIAAASSADAWMKHSSLASAVRARIHQNWPEPIAAAVYQLMDHSCFGLSGSFVLRELTRSNQPSSCELEEERAKWESRDLDLFGPRTSESVKAARQFLETVRPYVRFVRCLDHYGDVRSDALKTPTVDWCMNATTDSKTLFELKTHNEMLKPLYSFEYQPPNGIGINDRWTAFTQSYFRHIPTVCWTIYFVDPTTAAKCVHLHPNDFDHRNPLCCPAKHYGSIDIVLAVDHQDHSPVENDRADVFRWVRENFDADVCANMVFGRDLVMTHSLSAALDWKLNMRLEQYCCDIHSTNDKPLPAKYRTNPHPPCAHCSGKLRERLKKYHSRGFEITTTYPTSENSRSDPILLSSFSLD